MKKEVTIIVITYNSHSHIVKCLQSIKDNSKKDLCFNLIIIDNNSADIHIVAPAITTIMTTRDAGLKNTKFIKNKKNIGFAKAVNQGIKYAINNLGSDYFLLLNPDAYLGKNCIKKLVKRAEEDDAIGLISPLIVNPKNNQLWFSGAKIDWLRMKTLHHCSADNHRLQTTSYLSGCCLFISKLLVHKIGFFDERFFLYYEDADYSLRAQKAGFKILIEKEALCFHNESQSSSPKIKTYHLVRNGLIFFHKHFFKIAFPYFWLVFYLKLFYHKFFSKKKEVFQAIKDSRKFFI